MTEHLIQLRYTLRLRVLHHAAFQKVGHYDPAAVMAKLTKRLFEKYAGDLMKDRGSEPVELVPVGRNHIEFLNHVGASIVAQHETYVGAAPARASPPTQSRGGGFRLKRMCARRNEKCWLQKRL